MCKVFSVSEQHVLAPECDRTAAHSLSHGLSVTQRGRDYISVYISSYVPGYPYPASAYIPFIQEMIKASTGPSQASSKSKGASRHVLLLDRLASLEVKA